MHVPPFRIWPWLVAYAGLSAWLGLSRLTTLHSADSLLFTLAAGPDLTPFFWEQDRIGMLLPAINSWCPNPFLVLVMQTAETAFLGLLAPLLLARTLTTNPAAGHAVAVLNAVFLAWCPELFRETWYVVCNLPGAVALGCAGLGFFDAAAGRRWPAVAWRAAVGTAFVTLAVWQYVAVVPFLAVLATLRAYANVGPGARPGPGRGWRFLFRPVLEQRTVQAGLALGVATGAVMLLMSYVRARSRMILATKLALVPPAGWPEGWESLVRSALNVDGIDRYLEAAGIAVAVGVVAGLAFNRRGLRAMLPAAGVALAVGVVELLFLGTTAWVGGTNHYHPRYLVATITAASVAAALVAFVPVLSRLPRRVGGPFALALLAGAVAFRYGPPSAGEVRRHFDERFGAVTPAVLATGCDAVGGDYWDVLPAVLHANLVLYERGESRRVFAVCVRGDVYRDRIERFPEGFMVVLPDEDLAKLQAIVSGRGVGVFQRTGTVAEGVALYDWYTRGTRHVTLGRYATLPKLGE